MIDLKYKIWFAIKLEVEGYTGDVFDLCSLVPTDRCTRNLQQTGLIVKQQPNLLTHLIQVNASGPDVDKPVYPPISTLAFRYQLQSKGTAFSARTNIDALDPVNYTLYGSNNANNKSGSTLFMQRTGAAVSVADRMLQGFFGDVQSGTLAVADVFQNKLITTDYQLQDATGKCREPVFTLHFAKHP